MRKLIIVLSILFALSLTGALYDTQGRSDEQETVTAEQVYMHQFPYSIPDFTLY